LNWKFETTFWEEKERERERHWNWGAELKVGEAVTVKWYNTIASVGSFWKKSGRSSYKV